MSSRSVDRGRSNCTRVPPLTIMAIVSSSNLRQQGPCCHHVRGRKALGEPVMYRGEAPVALDGASGLVQQARERRRRPQLQRLSRLPSGKGQRLAQAGLGSLVIALELQELAPNAVQVGNVSALAGAGCVCEAFVYCRQPLVHAVRLPKPVGEHGQEHRPSEVGLQPLLHSDTIPQQRETFVETAERDERAALEGPAPFRFLRQSVLAAERDVFLAYGDGLTCIPAERHPAGGHQAR